MMLVLGSNDRRVWCQSRQVQVELGAEQWRMNVINFCIRMSVFTSVVFHANLNRIDVARH